MWNFCAQYTHALIVYYFLQRIQTFDCGIQHCHNELSSKLWRGKPKEEATKQPICAPRHDPIAEHLISPKAMMMNKVINCMMICNEEGKDRGRQFLLVSKTVVGAAPHATAELIGTLGNHDKS